MEYNVIEFAYSELKKYLEILKVDADIKLGIGTFDVEDPFFDDAYSISVKNKKGEISGSNERSVLFGVYRLLEEWGITWVRPGPNGTHYPEKADPKDLEINEKAYLRHRTMCIEGAISFENVTDMVDWMTKVGYNSYYVQFENAYIFFVQWYEHYGSHCKEKEPFSYQMIEDYMEELTVELKKRGLLFHRKGHGWHHVPFGLSEDPAVKVKPEDMPKSFLDLCAERDGKRGLYQNSLYLTNLCYTHPKVIETIVDSVYDYLMRHPETDVLHFWLADSLNTNCQCEKCSKTSFTDTYVNLINAVTDMFVEKGIKVKLSPVMGLNSAFEPKYEELRNRECLLLAFAPITRTFTEAFPDHYRRTEPPKDDGSGNGFKKSYDIDENLSYLYQWKKHFDRDWLDFDYHLMWDHVLEAGGENLAKVIMQDIKNLMPLGMNGYISCQLQRNAFPSSICMTVLAKTMWDNKVDFQKLRTELYEASFGADAVKELCDYFETVSDCFDVAIIKDEASGHDVIDTTIDKTADVAILRKKMVKVIKVFEEFKPVIENHLTVSDECQSDSWKYLKLHNHIYSLLAKSILERIDANYQKANELRDESIRFAFENEDFLQPVFDCLMYKRMVNGRIRVANPDAGAPELIGNTEVV